MLTLPGGSLRAPHGSRPLSAPLLSHAGCPHPHHRWHALYVCGHIVSAARVEHDSCLSREELMTFKVKELQSMLIDLGLPKSGTKDVLVDRLLAGRHLTGAGTANSSAAAAAQTVAKDESKPKRTRRSEPVGNGASTASSATAPAADTQPTGVKVKRGRPKTVPVQHSTSPPASDASTIEAPSSARTAHTRTTRASMPSADNTPASAHVQVTSPTPASAPVPQAADSHLPPLPVHNRGTSWAIHERDLAEEKLKVVLTANPTDLQITVLGTAAVRATPTRALASVALLRSKDTWLFDAGDDTQRQLGAVPHVKPSKLFRIFITSLSVETILGLPGLLCVLSAAKTKGHESADIPIHIYGPEGLADFLAPIFKVSNTYLEANILIVEFARRLVPPELTQPTLYNKRARIYRAVVPPDQHNPQGFFDGNLARFMPTRGRASFGGTITGVKSGGVLAFDERAAFLPFPDLPSGSPHAPLVPEHDMRWTIAVDISARITVVALPGQVPTLAYVYQEADRRGSLIKERCEALGITRGVDFGKLKEGTSAVELPDGRVIEPHMVVTADKPGRKVVIGGNGHALPDPGSAFHAAAKGADVLVAGWADTKANMLQLEKHAISHAGCVDVRDLGALTAQLGISCLLLSRFTSMPGPAVSSQTFEQSGVSDGPLMPAGPHLALTRENHVEAAVQEARAGAAVAAGKLAAKPPRVAAACDFWVQVFEKHEGPGPCLDD